MPDLSEERCQAFDQAVFLHADRFSRGSSGNEDVLATAAAFFAWLAGPVYLYLTIGPVVDQTTGELTGTIVGGSMAQLHDNEQFTLSVEVASAKGSPIPDVPGIEDDVSWTVDNAAVASLEISEDSRGCTVRAGSVGSAVITVALRELSATLAVDVIPGDAARLTISEGPISEQPI